MRRNGAPPTFRKGKVNCQEKPRTIPRSSGMKRPAWWWRRHALSLTSPARSGSARPLSVTGVCREREEVVWGSKAIESRCCAEDGELLAPWRRPAGGGVKPPHAALAEDRRGER